MECHREIHFTLCVVATIARDMTREEVERRLTHSERKSSSIKINIDVGCFRSLCKSIYQHPLSQFAALAFVEQARVCVCCALE